MSTEPTIYRSIARIGSEEIAALLELGVSTVVEALGPVLGPQQTMAEMVSRRTTRGKIAGQAITATNGLADNLMMHAALRVAGPGDVMVVGSSGAPGVQWGELVTLGAMSRKIAGAVTDGAVRDLDEIEKLGFPVWAASVRPLGARKDVPGWVNRPVNCGGVHVEPGDVIVADGDGVVVVPRLSVPSVVETGKARAAREVLTRQAVSEGKLPGDATGIYAKLDPRIKVDEGPWR